MKVWELRDLLKEFDSGKEVIIIRPSKDMGRTHLAIPITRADIIPIYWSAHHNDFIIPESEDEKSQSIEAVILI